MGPRLFLLGFDYVLKTVPCVSRAYKKNSRILSLKPLCINFVKSVLFRGAPNPASAIEIRHNVSDVNIAVATIGVLPSYLSASFALISSAEKNVVTSFKMSKKWRRLEHSKCYPFVFGVNV